MTVQPVVAGLTDDQQQAFAKMWNKWQSKRAKNQLLDEYYDYRAMFKNIGISIPAEMRMAQAALGWPAKAVQSLARKHVFEGYTLDGQLDPFGLDEILTANNFTTELPQAITAAYRHSCSFITVTAGDVAAGEPPVVIQARDAAWATGIWDRRRRCLSSAMAVTDTDDLSQPTGITLYFADDVVRLTSDRGSWSAEHLGNPTGRVLVEMLTYDPQLSRPFGHSRITREVRYLTDAAIRTLTRTEVSAEFFSAPQRYVLGAGEDAFDGAKWSAFLGRVWGLSENQETLQNPVVGQFPQMSMEPHLSMYRQLAQDFCSATNLPQSSVGLFADNPASAEAMQAAEYNLSDEAEYQWRIFSGPLRRVLEDATMVKDGSSEPPADSWKVSVNWTPARYVSPQAASDSIVKVVQALPKIADTTVAYRRAGFTQAEIDQMQAEWRRSEGGSLLDKALATARAGVSNGNLAAGGGIPAGSESDTNSGGTGPEGLSGVAQS